jgi:hypothetical protein
METFMKLFYGILGAAAFILAATDQTVAQQRAVLGQGNVSCQTWSADRKLGKSDSATRVAWILGYITAFNEYGSKPQGDVSAGSSTEKITTAIDDYCNQNPTDNVHRASAALIEEFRKASGR